MNATKLFFDKAPVIRAVDAATRRVLSRVGAFVRTTMRHSMHRRKAYSKPGDPPNAHRGDLRIIFFAWDPGPESVVIGPLGFKGSRVPELLEDGGDVIRRKRKGGPLYRAHYAARPYAKPALEANKGQLPEGWRGQVRSSP